MIFTARQLEDLHRGHGNGQLVLPYGARLTPLAVDWIKSKKIALGYSNVEAPTNGAANGPKPNQAGAGAGESPAPSSPSSPAPAGTILWWCDGPCGPAKAALMAQAKEAHLSPAEIGVAAPGAKGIVSAVKLLAGKIKSGEAAAGVLMVQTGAAALVFANRCPSLRAVLGTCLEAVEQGVRQVAANVLVIEYAHKTLPQMRNLLSRFVRGRLELPDEVKKQLQELSTCG